MSKNEKLYCDDCSERLFSDSVVTDDFFSKYVECSRCGATTAGRDVLFCARCAMMDIVCCGCGRSRERELERKRQERAREEKSRIKVLARNSERLPVRRPSRSQGRTDSGRNEKKRPDKKPPSRKKSRDTKPVRRPRNHFCWTSGSKNGSHT